MLSSHAFRSDPISSVQRNVKEFYSRPLITYPPPHRMESEEEAQMARSVSGWLRLHEQTEIDNLSELKLPYKVSLYRGRDGQKCIFWPQFPFFLPGGLFFPTFYPISLTLWFSLRFWQCRQFQCHCTCGWKPYFRNNRGCKRTAFSEANSFVHLIYSTQKT